MKSKELKIFDIGYISSKPVEVSSFTFVLTYRFQSDFYILQLQPVVDPEIFLRGNFIA